MNEAGVGVDRRTGDRAMAVVAPQRAFAVGVVGEPNGVAESVLRNYVGRAV